jgi:hypothetical protein
LTWQQLILQLLIIIQKSFLLLSISHPLLFGKARVLWTPCPHLLFICLRTAEENSPSLPFLHDSISVYPHLTGFRSTKTNAFN